MQKKLNDPRLERMASIIRVELSADLSFADVSISVMGTEAQQRAYMKGIEHAHGVLQKMIARNLRTRTCPTLRFHLDQSIKKGFEMMQMIDKSEAERAQRESEQAESNGPEESTTPENNTDQES
jgi:ribosome-binding factor A